MAARVVNKERQQQDFSPAAVVIDNSPLMQVYKREVVLGSDIENKLNFMAPDLNNSFLYRAIAFSLSGTCLVDLKCTSNAAEGSQSR
jgi:hypothetical protein